MTTTVIDAARKILLINEEPTKFTLSPAFIPGNLNRKAQLHLGRANTAFIDGHMESIPGNLFQQWQGKDADFYFNAGASPSILSLTSKVGALHFWIFPQTG
jgi:prepilin-type processing-associated H-X9-DG protein